MGQRVWFSAESTDNGLSELSLFTSLFWHCLLILSLSYLYKDMPISLVLGPLPLAFSSISLRDLPLSHGFNHHHSTDFSVFACSDDPSLDLPPLISYGLPEVSTWSSAVLQTPDT